MVYIYVLKLIQGKYYVGKTSNPRFRLDNHFNKNGSEWTRIYKPINIHQIIPDLYYYWDSPIEEDYNWRDEFPHAECMCEICFDIAQEEGKIKWNCASLDSGT